MATCRVCATPVAGEWVSCPECGTTISGETSPALLTGRFATVAKLKRSPARGEAQLVPGTILARRYRIVTRIGQGGMAEVYRAEDLRLGQAVALKFLTDDLAHSAAAIERFHQEVRLARQIAHPNVCRVFDIGDAEGRPFLAMEYIDGEDLAALLRRIGRLPVDKGLEIAQQLCAGLAAIHDSGIFHRDLKPSNILIDARGRARITDFGISAMAKESHGDRRRIGTPAYMAPEQLAGGEITVRTDLYALGLILYEMLTGSPAFGSEEPAGRRAAKRPAAPSALVREIDLRTERALLQCLEPDPAARPASALQLAAALPGLDPLAATAAAGETPSRPFVASPSKVGSLRPAVAAMLLILAVLFSLALALSGRARWIVNPLRLDRPPEVMADRAREILSRLGYTRSPSDWAYWYAFIVGNARYQKSLLTSGRLREALEFNQSRASQVVFVYRESPRVLAPHGPVISGSDPPLSGPGENLVWLDSAGRLRMLLVVADEQLRSRPPAPPDWRALLTAADLDPRTLTAVDPEWFPPVVLDDQVAWKGFVQTSKGTLIPFRVEAGSYRGAPVYFQIIEEFPKNMVWSAEQDESDRRRAIALRALYVFFFSTVLLGGVLLTRRHLRLKRADATGATRLAVFVFLFSMANSLILVGRLWSDAGDEFWLNSIGRALTWAALVWFSYVALEPILRRNWPERIVSWSRLLAGGYRDPLIGRDVLVGSLLGLGLLVVFSGRQLLVFARYGACQNEVSYVSISSTSHILQFILDNLMASLLMPLCFLVFFLSLKIVLRNGRAAALALWILLTIVLGLRNPVPEIWPWPWLIAALAAGLFVLAWTRLGLLVGVIQWLTLYLGEWYDLTVDLSSWYAARGLFSVGVPLVLAFYGFVVSTAGQRWIPEEVLDG